MEPVRTDEGQGREAAVAGALLLGLPAVRTRFRWNEAAGRYIDPRGRFVPRQAVRQALDEAMESSARKMREASEALRNRETTIARWQRTMRDEIKNLHLASGALAKGGWAQMTPADFGRVGQIVRQEYAYLRDFAIQIEEGTQPLDGRFMQRTRQYVQAGRKTYHQVERSREAARGMTEERNVLGVADHCEECLAASARGWVPIGTLPPIGDRICRRNCKCSIRYR